MTGTWLNIGSSGRQFPGFVNLDRVPLPGIQVCDVRLGLPFGDESVDGIVMSHVLEHLHPFWEAPKVLKDMFRVLKPGGLVRIAVPDLATLANAYYAPAGPTGQELGATQSELRDYIGVSYEDLPPALKFSVIAFGNNSGSPAYDGHQVLLDGESLEWMLERAGFTDVVAVEADESRHPDLLKTYQDLGAPEEVVVEATRP